MKFIHKLSDFKKFAFVSFICLGVFLITNHSDGYNNINDRYQFEEADIFQRKLLAPNDSMSLDHIKERFLDPPSTLPYNLQSQKHELQARIYQELRFKNSNKVIPFIHRLFSSRNGSNKGYFVEAGALDGEFLSNSLFLEKELGWDGLLVEPLTESYNKLRRKNRKAWSCHCCLGTKPYPYETLLAYHGMQREDGVISMVPREVQSAKSSVMDSSGFNYLKKIDILNLQYENIRCLPVSLILKALNVTKVDFFSLDLEGNEFGTLKKFPWSEVVVDVWAVEHKAMKNIELSDELKTADEKFISWFDKNGYDLNLFVGSSEDYIFIKRNSSVTNVKITVV